MVTPKEFILATRRAGLMELTAPKAVEAHYDRKTERIVIRLSSGLALVFPPHIAQGLEHATPSQLTHIVISPSGFGVHFPELDADLYIPSLVEGFFGSKKWMAARLGAAGGKSTSAAKSSAARANGKLGGRPKHNKAAAGHA